MGPDGVVVLLPGPNNVFGVVEGVKLVHLDAFATDFAVERLDRTGSPGLAWGGEHTFCFTNPRGRGFAHQLWRVIHVEIFRYAAHQRQHVELFRKIKTGDRVVDDGSQAFPVVFVRHGKDCEWFHGCPESSFGVEALNLFVIQQPAVVSRVNVGSPMPQPGIAAGIGTEPRPRNLPRISRAFTLQTTAESRPGYPN